MTNLQKRILTSIVAFPLSLFFVFKGGYFLLLFLLGIFFVANYELFSVFRKKTTILFLDLILILSLYSIYYLSDLNEISFYILLWIIVLVVCSDVGGYIFGKIFKWKKLTKISPRKTVSGVFGSFILSLLSVFIANILLSSNQNFPIDFLDPKFFFLAIIFSLIAQAGDLTISYFKKIEKVKDTGKILPGHGGILDRIDGLMFVVILVFILVYFNIIP